ncbi:hypothetical protein B296_00050389 [Ensete ventricosum]|uniref:Uncharacterized protein n=1 Tax=Ensete ventricosum TaxID=4639 RepID=A0A426YGL0_ENSVE|nr:hypothetical protein B296_00050389 [Ensete ventricosum]
MGIHCQHSSGSLTSHSPLSPTLVRLRITMTTIAHRFRHLVNLHQRPEPLPFSRPALMASFVFILFLLSYHLASPSLVFLVLVLVLLPGGVFHFFAVFVLPAAELNRLLGCLHVRFRQSLLHSHAHLGLYLSVCNRKGGGSELCRRGGGGGGGATSRKRRRKSPSPSSCLVPFGGFAV